MIRRYLPKNIQEFTHWYMRWVSPASLLVGFLLDNLIFLRRVDLWTGNALLLMHLLIAGSSIVFLNVAESGRLQNKYLIKIVPFLPVVAQFSFGALFSAFLSLYGRSAAFAGSWVFVVILAAFIILNERFAHFYMQLRIQIGVYFMVLFSFLIFFLPVVIHIIGPYMFVGSGMLSLLLIALFWRFLEYLVPERTKLERTIVARIVVSIFIVLNALYFSGAIPPLPLSLKRAGVYHNVSRAGDEYYLLYEPLAWYQYYLTYNTTYHRAPNEPVYVYTAIFAPSGLETTLYHQWQEYDEEVGQWNTVSTIPFHIVGGRDGGYRGYSLKSTGLSEGKWRVNVLTSYNQLIGRVSFTIEAVDTPVAVVSETR